MVMGTSEKNKAGEGEGSDDEAVCRVVKRVIKKGLPGKMTFLQKTEGGEGVSQADIWERAFLTEGTAGAKALRWV